MKRGLNFGKWKIALGAVTLGATVTVSVAALRANGTLFDPSAIADRQLRQNQVLFPGETDALKEETDREDESGWEEEESADDNEEQPRLFDESKQPEAPSDREQIMAQAQQNPQPTDLWEPIPEFTANENVIQRVNPARADEADGADARIIVNVPNGQGNGEANVASGGDNRSYYSSPSDRSSSSEDGNNDRSSSESGGRSGERNNSQQNTPAVVTPNTPVTPVVPEKLPEQPKVPVVPEKEVEPQQSKRHESAKDVNEVPKRHYNDRWEARALQVYEFPASGISFDSEDSAPELVITTAEREMPGLEEISDENNYGIVSGEPVTVSKIVKALNIYISEKRANASDVRTWGVFDENNELIEFKDYPDYATEDFTVKCRVRANKSQPWSEWTELTVPVYDQKMVFKVKQNGQRKEVRNLYLNEGETVNLLSACKLVPELGNGLNSAYLLNTTMLKGWSEGYDYFEEVDGDYVLRDEIEEEYDGPIVTAEKDGGRRVFYADMVERPEYLKVMLRKQDETNTSEYHQTLEWIWWSMCPNKLGTNYMDKLEVPEGIHDICFMSVYNATELRPGAIPTQINELVLPSTVRSVDFTNLVVYDSFKVSKDNPWLHASEDGKQLLDNNDQVVGKIYDAVNGKQKFILRFQDASGNGLSEVTMTVGEGDRTSLLYANQWAPYGENLKKYINGENALTLMLRGWREEKSDGPFVRDERIQIKEASGKPRIYYGEMVKVPDYMKIMVRQEIDDYNVREWNQTLEWIWWSIYKEYVPDYQDHHMDILEVPEGVQAVRLRKTWNDKSPIENLASGTPTDVNVLKLPASVRKVDFTNLVVHNAFVVDEENPWLHASSDGKILLDRNNEIVGKTQNPSAPKETIVLNFNKVGEYASSTMTFMMEEGESFSLMKLYTKAPSLNRTPYLSGTNGIQWVFEGWEEGSGDTRKFLYDDKVTIDQTGGQRDFYAVMKKKPQALKIKLIKKNDIYYQTLVGIWWDYYKDEIGEENVKNQHRDRFEVPVGVHGIQLGEVGGTADIDVLGIPYSLQSISFNDLKVQKGFEVDSHNKWFKTSEDGTQLIDKETGKVLYKALNPDHKEEEVQTDKDVNKDTDNKLVEQPKKVMRFAIPDSLADEESAGPEEPVTETVTEVKITETTTEQSTTDPVTPVTESNELNENTDTSAADETE